MADKLLAGDGNWTTDGNWSPSPKPVDADGAFISAALGANVTMPTSQKAIDLAVLEVLKGFQHSVGSSGAPIEITATLIKVFGSTGFYFKCIDDGSTVGDVDRIEIELPNASVIAELDGDASSANGEYKHIVASRGNILIKSAAIFTASTGVVEVGYVNNRRGDVNIKIESINTLPLLDINAGRVDCRSTVTDVRIANADYKQDDRAAANVFVFGGGVCEYLWSAGTSIKVFGGGRLDMSKNTRLTTIDSVTAYPDSEIIRDESIHQFTVFNDMRRRA